MTLEEKIIRQKILDILAIADFEKALPASVLIKAVMGCLGYESYTEDGVRKNTEKVRRVIHIMLDHGDLMLGSRLWIALDDGKPKIRM